MIGQLNNYIMAAMNEIMQELAQLGKVYHYVPKNYPNRMVSTAIEDTISATLLCVQEGIYHWVELPEGKYIDLRYGDWLLEVNGIYYFMD